MSLHRKAGELSVPEDSGMSTKSIWLILKQLWEPGTQ